MPESDANKMIIPGPGPMPPFDENKQLASELMNVASKLINIASRLLNSSPIPLRKDVPTAKKAE
jgi:hypothetical protein